jgi:spore maturation protein CgeB
MITFESQQSHFLLPQDFLRKAGAKVTQEAYIRCEPFSTPNEPHFAFDNYRCNGAVSYDASVLFYTQPGWGKHFEEKMGRNRVKCVTYACDPEVHKAVKLPYVYDVGFIGELHDVHGERQAQLSYLDENFICYISDSTPTQEIARELSKCKVLFNQIRYEEINIRFFEAMALGIQVVSYSPALHLFAEEGKHYLSYKTIEEASELIQMLLDNDTLREEMKAASIKHALENHTYDHRIKEMMTML